MTKRFAARFAWLLIGVVAFVVVAPGWMVKA